MGWVFSRQASTALLKCSAHREEVAPAQWGMIWPSGPRRLAWNVTTLESLLAFGHQSTLATFAPSVGDFLGLSGSGSPSQSVAVSLASRARGSSCLPVLAFTAMDARCLWAGHVLAMSWCKEEEGSIKNDLGVYVQGWSHPWTLVSGLVLATWWQQRCSRAVLLCEAFLPPGAWPGKVCSPRLISSCPLSSFTSLSWFNQMVKEGPCVPTGWHAPFVSFFP